MRAVAVYFTAPEFHGPPFDDPGYAQAYRALGTKVRIRGADFFIVRGDASRGAGAQFARGWKLEDGGFTAVETPFAVDVVFNKGEEYRYGPGPRTVNSKELDDLCRSKDKIYKLFPELFPTTKLVRTPGGLKRALPKLATSLLAAKPPDGACGRGVVIAPREELHAQVASFPTLVQEFIDTTHGIPGLVDGPHDLRVVVIAGTPVFAMLRTPAEGTLVANVAKGGNVLLVPLDALPEEVLAVAARVDAAMARFPERVYSIDMGLHEGREWKLIELNAPPGLTAPQWGEAVQPYYDALAEHLVRMAG